MPPFPLVPTPLPSPHHHYGRLLGVEAQAAQPPEHALQVVHVADEGVPRAAGLHVRQRHHFLNEQGNDVNFEAGAVTANHYNEREHKNISVIYDSKEIDTRCIKFGALVGDHAKIGANAVLSPGTILLPNSIVKRLELIDQLNNFTVEH